MGDIGVVDNNVINKAKNCDYLIIPVGGVYTVDAINAKEYVDKINPKCVIPIHYKLKNCTVDVNGVENFTNLFTNVTYVNNPYEVDENIKNVLVIKVGN